MSSEILVALSEEEARWLMKLMQNPIPNEKDESKYDGEMRLEIWASLHSAGVSVL